jgi:hypothetical protein
MATLVSKAAYAKLHGKSPQAAAKWETKGCLVLRDGKVHVEASDQRMQHAALGRFADPSTGAVNRQPKSSTVNLAPDIAVDPETGTLDLNNPQTVFTLSAFVTQLLTGNYADAATAATVKENALALKHVLAARKEAGELVDLETAERTLFEAARGTREAWMNFPSRAGPLMAAELGIETDRLVEVLSAHVHQLLADLGESEQNDAGQGAPIEGLPQGDDPSA